MPEDIKEEKAKLIPQKEVKKEDEKGLPPEAETLEVPLGSEIEPVKLPEIKPVDKTKTSNVEDDLGVHLTKTQVTDLTDGGASTLHKHDHGGMDGLGDKDHSAYIAKDGTTSDISADIPLNSKKLTGVLDPTANQDAATKKYVDDSVPSGAIIKVLLNDTASDGATISGSSSVEVKSFTLLGGTMGANGGIRVTALIKTDSEDWTGVINLGIGSQTVSGEGAGFTTTVAIDDVWHLEYIIRNVANESVQAVRGYVLQQINIDIKINADSKSVDTSANTTITINGKRTSGSEIGVLTVQHFMIELLPAP